MPPIQSTNTYQPIKGAMVMLFAFLVSTGGMLAAVNSYGNAEQEQEFEQASQQHIENKGPDFRNIVQKLQLTEAQKVQLESALRSHQKERRGSHIALRKKHKNERQEMRNSHKSALEDDLASFLSEGQITQLQQILRKNRHRAPCDSHCKSNTASRGSY